MRSGKLLVLLQNLCDKNGCKRPHKTVLSISSIAGRCDLGNNQHDYWLGD
jgi:hypothetical protein